LNELTLAGNNREHGMEVHGAGNSVEHVIFNVLFKYIDVVIGSIRQSQAPFRELNGMGLDLVQSNERA